MAHFRPPIGGNLVEDGVCGALIGEKLRVSQPTASEHLNPLAQAGLVRTIKQWTFDKRDEVRIEEVKQEILTNI